MRSQSKRREGEREREHGFIVVVCVRTRACVCACVCVCVWKGGHSFYMRQVWRMTDSQPCAWECLLCYSTYHHTLCTQAWRRA